MAGFAGDAGHGLLPVAKRERAKAPRVEEVVGAAPLPVDGPQLRGTGGPAVQRRLLGPIVATEAVWLPPLPAGEAGHAVAAAMLAEGVRTAVGPLGVATGADARREARSAGAPSTAPPVLLLLGLLPVRRLLLVVRAPVPGSERH